MKLTETEEAVAKLRAILPGLRSDEIIVRDQLGYCLIEGLPEAVQVRVERNGIISISQREVSTSVADVAAARQRLRDFARTLDELLTNTPEAPR
jgi:hypothetical protein